MKERQPDRDARERAQSRADRIHKAERAAIEAAKQWVEDDQPSMGEADEKLRQAVDALRKAEDS